MRSCFASAVMAIAFAVPAWAEVEHVEVISSITPGITQTGETYQSLMAGIPAKVQAIYATEVIITQGPAPKQAPTPRERRDPLVDGSWGPLVIIGLFAALVAVVFITSKANGASASEHTERRAPIVPDGWAYDEPGLGTRERLRRISMMPDKEKAMVLLLRYSLLSAAEQTQAQFTRSDTERDAFKRVPERWQKRSKLGDLLQRTELAHYGGRAITEENFARALEDAQAIMLPGEARYG